MSSSSSSPDGSSGTSNYHTASDASDTSNSGATTPRAIRITPPLEVPGAEGSVRSSPRKVKLTLKAPAASSVSKGKRYEAYKRPGSAEKEGDDEVDAVKLAKELKKVEKQKAKEERKRKAAREKEGNNDAAMDAVSEMQEKYNTLKADYDRLSAQHEMDKAAVADWVYKAVQDLQAQNAKVEAVSNELAKKEVQCRDLEQKLSEAAASKETKDLKKALKEITKAKSEMENQLGSAFQRAKQMELEITQRQKEINQKDQELIDMRRRLKDQRGTSNDQAEMLIDESKQGENETDRKDEESAHARPELSVSQVEMPIVRQVPTKQNSKGKQKAVDEVGSSSQEEKMEEDEDPRDDASVNESLGGNEADIEDEYDPDADDDDDDDEQRKDENDNVKKFPGEYVVEETDAEAPDNSDKMVEDPPSLNKEPSPGPSNTPLPKGKTSSLASNALSSKKGMSPFPSRAPVPEQGTSALPKEFVGEKTRNKLGDILEVMPKEGKRVKKSQERHLVVANAIGELPELPLQPVTEMDVDEEIEVGESDEEEDGDAMEKLEGLIDKVDSEDDIDMFEVAKLTVAMVKSLKEAWQEFQEAAKPKKTVRPKGKQHKDIRDEYVAKYTQQHGKGVVKDWKAEIAGAFRHIYGVKVFQDFDEYMPIFNEEEIQKVEDRVIQMPPSTLTLYFGPNFERTRWNRTIIEDIADAILKKHAKGKGKLPPVDREWICTELYGQLRQAQRAWKAAQVRAGETAETAMKRLATTRSLKDLHVRSYTRRSRKYDSRLKLVQNYIKFSQGRRNDIATWQWLEKLLIRLQVNGMSSDTEGVQVTNGVPNPVFFTRSLPWRAPQIAEYLGAVDALAWSAYVKKVKGITRKLRVREAGELRKAGKLRVSTEFTPVEGLPRLCYNEKWLRGMEKADPGYATRTLKVTNEPFKWLEFLNSKRS